MLTDNLTRGKIFCMIDCMQAAHTSPFTMISHAVQGSILLKTHVTQIAGPTTNQKVGSSSPPGRTILANVFRLRSSKLFQRSSIHGLHV
jgi:hypothetical protein